MNDYEKFRVLFLANQMIEALETQNHLKTKTVDILIDQLGIEEGIVLVAL